MHLNECIHMHMYCSERPGRTAARECFEETLGVLGQTDHLLSLLEKKEENNVFQVSVGIASLAVSGTSLILLAIDRSRTRIPVMLATTCVFPTRTIPLRLRRLLGRGLVLVALR